MRRTGGVVAATAGALLAGLLAVPAWAAGGPGGAGDPGSPGGVGVDGDPAHAAYVGTSGLLLPADAFTGTEPDRAAVATCPDCRWALVPLCKRSEPTGGLGCTGLIGPCPAGERRMVVYLLRPPDRLWQVVGTVCVGPSGPVTVADMAQRLHDVVIEYVPPQHPAFQPPDGAVVNLPAVFSAGQPASMGRRSFRLLGFGVVLEAGATFEWEFDAGVRRTFAVPGGRWPDTSVTYTYRSAGARQVVLTTRWQGRFTVDGLGPFPVGGPPVDQVSDPVAVPVRQALSQLVAE